MPFAPPLLLFTSQAKFIALGSNNALAIYSVKILNLILKLFFVFS
jgi:hypothetical protein